MQPDQKPRLEPRLVFIVVMLAVPVLILIVQTLLVRPGEACEQSPAGGLSQLFVPGVGCDPPPPSPAGRP